MNKALYYSNHDFNRAGELRESSFDEPVSSCQEEQLVIPVWHNKFFFKKEGDGSFDKIPACVCQQSTQTCFLGLQDGKEIICVDVSGMELSAVVSKLGEVDVCELLEKGSDLPKKQASLLAFARGIVHWNRNHLFCSVCGSETTSIQRGHCRQCRNEDCSRLNFPRVDPAVTVLIEHQPKNGDPLILLNLRKVNEGYRCSLFSGFMEIGENFEDAAIREMKEEVDVDVKNLQYVNSQPWPFPASLMVGLTAVAETRYFKVDNHEITEAGWFSALEIQEMVHNKQLTLPPNTSITGFLIDAWLNKKLVCQAVG
ncbi:MAG: NAD(+) diphosphatase [Marinilabiliaceae bacterium]|nr:NAD(+) diphosphatase [Marinilabiliaceae bacterium]